MGLDMYLRKGKRIPKKSELESMEILEKLDIFTRDYEEIEPEVRKEFGDYILKDYKYADLYDGKPYYVTSVEIGYWRKANAIHKWFVDNVQNGEDDCDNYLVTKENIEELKDICQRVFDSMNLIDDIVINGYKMEKNEDGELIQQPCFEEGKIIEDSTLAQELLPTQDGFFFGGTQYDEWYYEDIKYTLELCKNILNLFDFEHNYLMYRSSW